MNVPKEPKTNETLCSKKIAQELLVRLEAPSPGTSEELKYLAETTQLFFARARRRVTQRRPTEKLALPGMFDVFEMLIREQREQSDLPKSSDAIVSETDDEFVSDSNCDSDSEDSDVEEVEPPRKHRSL